MSVKPVKGMLVPAGAGLLLVAGIITVMTGKTGISEAKITGFLLAVVTFLPVFFMMVRAMRTENPNTVMATLVGGFFYKLLVISFGVWWGIKKAGFPTMDFAVACLSFLFALQIFESLYFASKK